MSRHVGRIVSRRHFLAASLCAIAGCLPPVRRIGNGPVLLEQYWRELAAQVPDAVPLGSKYLQQHPEEASADWLEAKLLGAGQAPAPFTQSLDKIRTCIATGRESDYRLGRLAVLDGWALPETDARLLALLSLRAA